MTLKSLVRSYARWSKLVYCSNILLVGCVGAAAELWDLKEKAPWLAWPILFSLALIVLMFIAESLEIKWDATEKRSSWERERKLRRRD